MPENNPYIDLHANFWATHLSDDYMPGEAENQLEITNLSRDVLTMGAELYNTSILETPLGSLTLSYGGQFSREDADAEKTWRIIPRPGGRPPTVLLHMVGPAGIRTLAGGFLRGTWEITDWLSVGGGVRYDYYKIEQTQDQFTEVYDIGDFEGERINPSVNITLTPVEGVQLYGLYTEGWRPPSLRETSFFMRQTLLPNPDLKPEIAKNYEFGVNVLRHGLFLENDALRFKFSYFFNNYEDYIVRSPGSIRYTWDNIDKAKFQGFELSGGYDMRYFFIEGSFTHYDKIEYCIEDDPVSPGCGKHSATTDYGSNYVPPKTAASLTLGTRLFDEALTLGFRATHNSERALEPQGFTGINPPTQWPASTIYDVFASYEVTENLLLTFSAENLTDEYYLDPLTIINVPSPGLTIRAGVTLRF